MTIDVSVQPVKDLNAVTLLSRTLETIWCDVAPACAVTRDGRQIKRLRTVIPEVL